MINDLSREPDRSMLGFSREVAREVTHPEWPSRVPLRMSCSVILRDRLGVAQSICDVEFGQNIEKYSAWAGSLSDTLKPLARLHQTQLCRKLLKLLFWQGEMSFYEE
jgi:hypothetical protein